MRYQNLWGYPEIDPTTRLGAFVDIGKGVKIGKFCKIQAGAFIPPGVTIGDYCFIGPHVCFTNDKYPALRDVDWQLLTTVVEDEVVIGAGAIILPGLTIGKGARIGAGAVVTKDVPPGETWVGNPAKKI